MILSGVRVRPERSHQRLALWFTNKKNLKERITHPEYGLWKNKNKVPQLLLSVPREHKRVLMQKQYISWCLPGESGVNTVPLLY